MAKPAILASGAAVVLLGTGSAFAGNAHPALSIRHAPRHEILLPHRGSHLLYDQSEADNGTAISAENFESALDAYDAEGADDFKVPAGQTWKVTEVYVAGIYFEGSRSNDSFNVAFYKSRKGKPGKLVKACPNASYRYDTQFDFGSEYIACRARLKAGAYFVAVQANTIFFEGGEWGWLTNNTVRGHPSLWRNPGDGFATGCTDFTLTTTCIPDGEGGDFAFALYGKTVETGP